MKALYVSPTGKKVELPDSSTVEGHITIDMEAIRAEILNRIRTRFKSLEIADAAKDFTGDSFSGQSLVGQHDIFLCDLTTGNGNAAYLAGLAEAMQKPVIYIRNSEASTLALLREKRILNYSSHSLSDEFFTQLSNTIESAINNPTAPLPAEGETRKSSAFISYSHRDKQYLDRLMVHLKPIQRKDLLDVWVDTRIKTGDKWRDSIQDALSQASIAILLISADFLASDFIVDNELPPILLQAEVKGTRIIPVILSSCRFSRDPTLNCFQSVNNPAQPLSAMTHDEREAIYDHLVEDIEKAIPSLRQKAGEGS